MDLTGAAAIALDLPPARRRWLRRPRASTLLLGVAAAAVTVLLTTRFRSDVVTRLASVPTPRWHWLGVCLVASVGFYVANGVGMRAASGLRMSLADATAAQVAAAAANRIVPVGIGAIAVHVRFLERRGLARSAAVAAVASVKVAGGLVHIAGIALVAGTLNGSGIGTAVIGPVRSTIDSVGLGGCAACLLVVGVGTGSAFAHPRVRRRLQPALAGMRSHLALLAHSPRRTALLVTSLAGTKVAQIAALASAVWAFDGGLSLLSVAAVYLVGSAVAGAVPTAGNVGAVEPALAIGLAAAGGGAAAMLTAVLVFRLISYWLPVLPGLIAMAALRRRGDL